MEATWRLRWASAYSDGTWAYSDFSIPIRGARPVYRGLDFAVSDTLPGSVYRLWIRPIVKNDANGTLDSLTAVVREKSGHGAMLDSTIVWTPLSPLDVSGSADSACVEVPVSMPLDSLAFDIALRQCSRTVSIMRRPFRTS